VFIVLYPRFIVPEPHCLDIDSSAVAPQGATREAQYVAPKRVVVRSKRKEPPSAAARSVAILFLENLDRTGDNRTHRVPEMGRDVQAERRGRLLLSQKTKSAGAYSLPKVLVRDSPNMRGACV
jgi:hypothetical protein